jgi:acyl-CoA synthetase (NDP forming)
MASRSVTTPRRGEAPDLQGAPQRLAEFFAPRSLAVVGASDESFWCRNVFRNLAQQGFSGPVVPVSRRRKRVFDRDCLASLRDLAAPVDLAYILAPTNAVGEVLADAAAAGVRNAVVVAAGFGETGEEGGRLQRALVQQASDAGLCLLGPNCPGFLNMTAGVSAYGQEIPEGLRNGGVAVLLQSGALAQAVLKFSRAFGIGISTLVCMGNEAVLSAADVLEHLIRDPATRVIAMFLEEIRDGARFLALARQALAAGKPVVVLKVGRTPAGQRSALAHTGAVAGDAAVTAAALRQAGVASVRSLEELLLTAGLLAQGPRLRGRRMAVVTGSGGACDIIADRASDEGLELPAFSPATTRFLADYLPDFATVQNPLDVAAIDTVRDTGTPATAMDVVAERVGQDIGFDLLLYMGFNMVPPVEPAPPERQKLEARIAHLGGMMRSSPVPVIAVSQTCLDVGHFARGLYDASGIYLLGGIEFGLTAIGHAVRWEEARAKAAGQGGRDLPAVPSFTFARSSGAWSEAAGRALLLAAGAPVVPAELTRSADEAVAAAGRLGFPVAAKICSPQIAHKSDVGGVALDLRNPADLRAAFARIRASAEAVPGATVEGVLVGAMRPPGVELFVGLTVDPTFGPTLAVGLGGVWIEVLKDVALRVLPVTEEDIVEMLRSLKGRPLLEGARGRRPVDLRVAARAILQITQAGLALGSDLRTLEVNPLWCDGAAVEALDVLVVT